MFDLFGKKTAKDFLQEAKDTYSVPEEPVPLIPLVPEDNNAPTYQIGKTEDGRVTFRIGNYSGGSTLIMNNAGVDTLIKMLEAAKEPEDVDPNPTDV